MRVVSATSSGACSSSRRGSLAGLGAFRYPAPRHSAASRRAAPRRGPWRSPACRGPGTRARFATLRVAGTETRPPFSLTGLGRTVDRGRRACPAPARCSVAEGEPGRAPPRSPPGAIGPGRTLSAR